MSVSVAAQGVSKQKFDFTDGSTVNDYLCQAGFEMSKESTLTVNGQDAKPEDKVNDNDLIVITSPISNG
jgi:hypothetical protein